MVIETKLPDHSRTSPQRSCSGKCLRRLRRPEYVLSSPYKITKSDKSIVPGGVEAILKPQLRSSTIEFIGHFSCRAGHEGHLSRVRIECETSLSPVNSRDDITWPTYLGEICDPKVYAAVHFNSTCVTRGDWYRAPEAALNPGNALYVAT